ncbi:MAG: S41 family peptidase, partial [Pseudomonadota bacterium]
HWYGAHRNYGVQRIDRLENNVGYLDLRVFAPLDMGGDTLVAAMNVLADMDAMIIDLRHNGGGMADAADLVASYLFDGGRQPLTGVYDRPTDTLTQRFTQPYVSGRRFGFGKPVYVLQSKDTFSAAEALAYNLQALDRATIVGEVSGGGAHPFEYVPLTDHYVLWSVTARSINPITKGNWQGVGVKPDIEVDADSALGAALAHLRERAL